MIEIWKWRFMFIDLIMKRTVLSRSVSDLISRANKTWTVEISRLVGQTIWNAKLNLLFLFIILTLFLLSSNVPMFLAAHYYFLLLFCTSLSRRLFMVFLFFNICRLRKTLGSWKSKRSSLFFIFYVVEIHLLQRNCLLI